LISVELGPNPAPTEGAEFDHVAASQSSAR
jgi:hypothetical protein